MGEKDVKQLVERAADFICISIVQLAEDRKDALEGIKALHRDMVKNINKLWDAVEEDVR